MSNGITIQINSVDALKHLLANDAEMTIQVRQAVLKCFAQNSVDIFTKESMAYAHLEIKNLISEKFREEGILGGSSLGGSSLGGWQSDRLVAFSPKKEDEIKALIQKNLENLISTTIENYVEKKVGEILAGEDLGELIEQKVVSKAVQLARDEFKEKYQKALKALD